MTEKREGKVDIHVYVCVRQSNTRGEGTHHRGNRSSDGHRRDEMRDERSFTARNSLSDRCVCITGSVMDLYSRRPGMFENSRSSGMWPAEPPSAVSLFSLQSPALRTSLRAQWTLLGRLPTSSPCPAVLP